MTNFFKNKEYETITDLCYLMQKWNCDKSTLIKWHNYTSLYDYLFKDIKDKKEMRFERVGEFIPMGIKQDRYFACFWKRV